ncbi:MAG: hypothetical protein AB7P21_27640 [Lautropia sp.]
MKLRPIHTLTLAATLLTATAASAQTKLLLSTFFPPGHPIVAKVLVPWAKDVETSTAGRVKIEFASSSLAPPPGQLDMVQKGIADVALQYTGVVPKRLQPEMLTELPGPGASSVQMSKALWATHERYFQKDARYKGVKLMSLFAFPNQGFYCLKECFTTIDEFHSAKIATTPGTAARQWGALTSGIVAGPAVRYFEVVSKGIVDAYAAVTPIEVSSFNLAPSTKGVLRFKNLETAGSFAFVLNQRKWDGLGDADKAAIARLGGAAFADRLAALDEASAASVKQMKEAGFKFSDASDALNAELRKRFAFLEKEWIKDAKTRGIDGTAAVKFYREQLIH